MKEQWENQQALYEILAETAGVPIEHGDLYDVIRSPQSIWPNQVYNFKRSSSETEQILTNLKLAAQDPYFPPTILISNSDHNWFLVKALEQQFKLKYRWPILGCALDSIEFGSNNHQVQGCLPDDVDRWLASLSIALMDGHRLNAEVWHKIQSRTDFHFLKVEQNGQIVGTALLFSAHHSAGLYLVSTLESHRRQGIARALTLEALERAKTLGHQQVLLQATAEGLPLYLSLGFVQQGEALVFSLKDL